MNALKYLRSLLAHNLGLKIGALTLSVLAYSLVHGAEDMQRTVYIDVLVQPPDDSEDMMLITEMPDRVRVRLQGSRARINAVRPENIPPLEVRPRSVTETRHYFEETDVELPTGVTASQIGPAWVDLIWTKRVVKQLPVEVLLSGELEKGLRMAGPAAALPATVRVEGPEGAVRGIKRVRTTEIYTSELAAGDNRREVGLIAPPPNSKFSPSAVTVTVPVVEDLEERVIPKLRVSNVGAGVRSIRPRYVQVRVQGARPGIRSVNLRNVEAAVELGAIPATAEPVTLPVVLLNVPDSVQVVSVEPPEVTVQLLND